LASPSASSFVAAFVPGVCGSFGAPAGLAPPPSALPLALPPPLLD